MKDYLYLILQSYLIKNFVYYIFYSLDSSYFIVVNLKKIALSDTQSGIEKNIMNKTYHLF